MNLAARVQLASDTLELRRQRLALHLNLRANEPVSGSVFAGIVVASFMGGVLLQRIRLNWRGLPGTCARMAFPALNIFRLF